MDMHFLRDADATVFVVDDDEAVRKSLVRLLRSMACKVEAFASASEFLKRFPIIGLGCVLLDVQMPGINGLELLNLMSEAGIFLPVIFLSGKGNIPMSVEAMKHGAIDFLVKPVQEDILFQSLNQAIKRHDADLTSRQKLDCIMSRLARLSQRENEVLKYVLLGHLNKQIAFDLGIAEKTVKVHRSRVMEKMEADSLAALVHMCDAVNIEFPNE
jgi:FixJ family two-component response regulator